ncbi:unnamed protein product, partial [Heterosigma akashiwo]
SLNARDVLLGLLVLDCTAMVLLLITVLSVLTFDPVGVTASALIPLLSNVLFNTLVLALFQLGFTWYGNAARQRPHSSAAFLKQRTMFKRGVISLITLTAAGIATTRAYQKTKPNMWGLDSIILLYCMILGSLTNLSLFVAGRYLVRALLKNDHASYESRMEAKAINRTRFLLPAFYLAWLLGQISASKVTYLSAVQAWIARIPVTCALLGIQYSMLSYLNKSFVS